MSTRSRIGTLEADGTVTSVYCHFDGYLSGVGATLLEHYSDGRKVRALMRVGSMSVLRDSAKLCDATGEPASSHPAGAWPGTWQEFEYLWREKRWYFRKVYNKRPVWTELTAQRVKR